MRRTCTIGIVALLLAVFAVRTPAVGRVVSSARNFGKQFHALKSAHSLGPIERFVLSLARAS